MKTTARTSFNGQPSLRADPPVGPDGRCPNCGNERPEIAVKNGDPFCSTACARGWHDPAAKPSPSTSR